MLKDTIIGKITYFSTVCSFVCFFYPQKAEAYNLSPLSFSKMYHLAQNGDVEALRASIRRGLNINVMNKNGDTGLCIAAKNKDAYTYNAFRAAGANPRHPCVQNISDYEEFVNSSKVVSLNSSPRKAFRALGKEKYSISPTTWWIVGGLAVGGGVAALASGGGGGGGDSATNEEIYESFGDSVASSGKVSKSTSGTMVNDDNITLNNTNIAQITKINLRNNILNNANFMNAVLRAEDGGSYTNSKNTSLQIGSGVIGMVATDDSSIINNGYINADGYNAAIGMVASNGSSAVNNGSNVNGINLNFSGYKDDDTLVGMYADSKSSIKNNGDISGTAILASKDPTSTEEDSSTEGSNVASSSSEGSIIGMEAMIVNVGNNLKNDYIDVENNGNIELSAGDGGTNQEIKVSLVGMGSYLDDGFLNGSKNINRAENVSLVNKGDISIGYTGTYNSFDENSLRKGLGGVVGIRADANSTAVNFGNISIDLTDDDAGTGNSIAVATGMQSVHGGNILNEQDGVINIETSATNGRISYGLLSVEGSGTVSGLYTNLNQSIMNYGQINMVASNSMGMASYNGGEIINNGKIVLGSETNSLYSNNIGLYGSGVGTTVNLTNTGEINVYSHDSVAMENDYSGGTVITNDGIINIYENATDSHVFGGNYSQLVNNGFINYYATPNSSSGSSEGLGVGIAVMTTKGKVFSGEESSQTSSTTEKIYNNKVIKIDGATNVAAMMVETSQGKAYNNGTINITEEIRSSIGSVGMYLNGDSISAALLSNNGFINSYSDYTYGMASDASSIASMTNELNGVINMYGDYSYGMYASGNSYVYNKGSINLYGDNSVAIYSSGTGENQEQGVISNRVINVYGDNNIGIKIANGGTARIVDLGAINICTKGNNCSQTAADTFTYIETGGKTTLDSKFVLEKGTFIKVMEGGEFVNNATLTTNSGKLIYALSGSAENNGSLNINGSDGYAIWSGNGSTSKNNNEINVNGSSSYGIYIESGGSASNELNATINVSATKSRGVYMSNGTSGFTNAGDINVTANNSYGIYAESGAGEINNTGNIYIKEGVTDSYGIYAGAETTINNTGNIISESDSYAVYALGDGTVTNTGSIVGKTYGVEEENTQGASVQSFLMAKTGGKIINNGIISTNSSMNFDEYTDGTGIISVGENGVYEATSLKGTVTADSSIVQNAFETLYKTQDSFIGEDLGLNVISGSYLFNAEKQTNDNGNTDIIMTMKSFDEVVSNKSFANYLNDNYKNEKGENVFNNLKGASSSSLFNQNLAKEFGFNFVPNLAKQKFDTEKLVNREIVDDILEYTPDDDRAVLKFVTLNNDVKEKGIVSNYNNNVNAVYGFKDYSINKNIKVGYGLSLINSDFDSDNYMNGYNNVFEVFAPISFNNTYAAVIKPKIGYGWGHYRRQSVNSVHKENTEEYYYGVESKAQKSIDVGFIDLEPNLGFNITGLYMKDINETNNGLKIDGKSLISAESTIGLDLKKKISFNKDQTLLIKVGGTYFHEFGDKYKTKATVDNMIGKYSIVSNRMHRNYGLLSVKARYNYNRLSISASANIPLSQDNNDYYLLGIGYNF